MAVRGYALRAAEWAGAVAGLVIAAVSLIAGCALIGVGVAGGGGAVVAIAVAVVLIAVAFARCAWRFPRCWPGRSARWSTPSFTAWYGS
jgi:hypothetical protein